MSSVKKIELHNLTNFGKDNSYLNIVERDKPYNADIFFEKLLLEPFNINMVISKKNILNDLKYLLIQTVPKKVQENIFYHIWLKDMAKICKLFCDTLDEICLNFSLETSRTCKRYHIDNVPIRLLVTYYGKGTEWLPRSACNYEAYYRGEKNEKIIKNKKEIKFIDSWNIAIFKGQMAKGGEKGILHRTPDDALNRSSLIMRLDSASFMQ